MCFQANKNANILHIQILLLQIHQELRDSCIVRNESFITFVPIRRADFSVYITELKSLDHTDRFIHTTTNSIIIYINMTDFLIRLHYHLYKYDGFSDSDRSRTILGKLEHNPNPIYLHCILHSSSSSHESHPKATEY